MLTVSLPVELIDQNPWWRNPKAIEQDNHILELEKSRVKWDPRLRRMFTLDKDIVYTLRGPRQVGKTTLLKNMIRGLSDGCFKELDGGSPRFEQILVARS